MGCVLSWHSLPHVLVCCADCPPTEELVPGRVKCVPLWGVNRLSQSKGLSADFLANTLYSCTTQGDWDPDNSMIYLGAGVIVPREGGCPYLACCHRAPHKAEAWAATTGVNKNGKSGERGLTSSLAQVNIRLS